jgi:hypothetical protein
VGRTLDIAFYSTTWFVCRAQRRLAAISGKVACRAGILQQTLDLDMLETYTRPPRADSFAFAYFRAPRCPRRMFLGSPRC